MVWRVKNGLARVGSDESQMSELVFEDTTVENDEESEENNEENTDSAINYYTTYSTVYDNTEEIELLEQINENTLNALAVSESVYQGTISTTYLTYFADITNSLGISDNYVMWRSGDSSYSMLAGDIECSGSNFYLSSGKLYTITNVSGSYGSSAYYNYSVSSVSDYSLSANNMLVYSDLGDYPSFTQRGEIYGFTTLFMLTVCAFACVLTSLFRECVRLHSRYS